MKKRTAGLLGIFLAAAMMTAACGSDNSQETAEKTAPKTETKDNIESKDDAEGKDEAKAADDETTDNGEKKDAEEPVTILMAAAASLEYSMKDELVPKAAPKHYSGGHL